MYETYLTHHKPFKNSCIHVSAINIEIINPNIIYIDTLKQKNFKFLRQNNLIWYCNPYFRIDVLYKHNCALNDNVDLLPCEYCNIKSKYKYQPFYECIQKYIFNNNIIDKSVELEINEWFKNGTELLVINDPTVKLCMFRELQFSKS